jgi:prolycopene isomerase
MHSAEPIAAAGGDSDSFEVIVVGSGIGGMTAAALLARAGQRVLVAEQHSSPGGYAHSFRRGPYIMDPAVHSIIDPRLFDALLRHLDVREHCTLIPVNTFYTVFIEGQRFQVPLTGWPDFVEAHVSWFPESAQEIRAFFAMCRQIHRDAHNLPQRLGLDRLDEVAARFPTLFKYRNAVLADVLEEFIRDPRPRALCAALSLLLGLGATRLPFQSFAQMMGGYLAEGGFCVQGGAEEVIRAMAIGVERDGGRVLCNSRVTRILVEDGQARGVLLKDGRRFSAPVVISNAPVPLTFEELVGPEHVPEPYLRKLRRLKVSGSAFIFYGATRLDLPALGVYHTNFLLRTWDLDAAYDFDVKQGRANVLGLFAGVVDPTLAPPGEHVFTCLLHAPYDIGTPWAEAKPEFKAMMLKELGLVFPGFADHLVFSDVATPLTLERFSMNTGGAIYGWENTLQHVGSKRPSPHTPVAGLYLAGHWTQPGTGWLRSAVSGMLTSRLVLKDKGLLKTVEVFEAPSLPPAE